MLEPALLDPEAAARYLGIGRSKIYGLLQAGDLHGVKVGRARRFTRTELDRFVEHLERNEADSLYPR